MLIFFGLEFLLIVDALLPGRGRGTIPRRGNVQFRAMIGVGMDEGYSTSLKFKNRQSPGTAGSFFPDNTIGGSQNHE